jgi:mannosyltransferase
MPDIPIVIPTLCPHLCAYPLCPRYNSGHMVVHGGEPTGRRLFAPLLMLLVLVLLAYALRLHNLEAFSFWTDEGLTPERSGYPVAQILRNEILIQGYITKDTHPPLYYLVLHATRQVFGESDFAFRYPSVLFGVLLVPLIFQLARRMDDLTLGLLVALLAAVNPLQVYYSQEARMYTLLVLLVTGMSYVLWRAIETTYQVRNTRYEIREDAHSLPLNSSFVTRHSSLLIRHLLVYGALAGLAFYTHYTAAFLIAVQALFWVWLLWRNGLKWVILGAAGLGLLLAIPLVPHTIPRLFSGAEANYAFVSPLTMLQDVVHFFNLGLTTDFDQFFIKALDVVALGLLLLGLWAARPWLKRSYLLAWLLAVVVGLMAGSILFKPMYQGVRHIMAGSPAYLLLLGYGIRAFWNWLPVVRVEQSTSEHDLSDRVTKDDPSWWEDPSPRFNPLALLPLSLLLIGAAVALANLYTNPAYVKDDFRAIIRYIEEAAGDQDVIVYNNAILLPLHEHYQNRHEIDVTALPIYPEFATGAEEELLVLAQDYDRIWFITDPPADRRDEDKLIQGWFDDHLLTVSNRLFPARTTEARVITFATADPQPDSLPDDAHPLDLTWDGLPGLHGVVIGSPQPLARRSLWVDLFWQGERPPDNAVLRFSLIGPDGREYFAQNHRLLGRERALWEMSTLNRRSYDLSLPDGLPPGSYALLIAPESGAAETLSEIAISGTDFVPNGRPAARWENGLTLQTIELWDDTVLPGNNLPLTLTWHTGSEGINLSGIRYRLEVIGPDSAVLRFQEDRPGASWLENVEPDKILREVTGLFFRPETPPGRYRLRWTLLQDGEIVGRPVMAGRLTVEPWPLVTELPAVQTIVEAEFGPAILLGGFDRGETSEGFLPITLYWQSTAAPAGDFLVFIHLIEELTGQTVAQVDGIPADGLRLTSGWRPGEVITDSHLLPVPADLEPGRYHVYIGLYDPDSGERLPVRLQGDAQPDARLHLLTLDLPEATP